MQLVLQVPHLLLVLRVLRLHQVEQHMGAQYLRLPLVLRKYSVAQLVLLRLLPEVLLRLLPEVYHLLEVYRVLEEVVLRLWLDPTML